MITWCTRFVTRSSTFNTTYLDEFGQGSVEEKEGRVETMAESGEFE